MEKNKAFILGGALALILLMTFLFGQKKKPVENIEKKQLSEQTLQIGEVTIIATPKRLVFNEKPTFNLQFDTHSIELTFDIAGLSSLVDDKGKRLTGAIWEGSPPGGHHRSGELFFPDPLQQTDNIELVIEQVLNDQEARFKWNLKGGE